MTIKRNTVSFLSALDQIRAIALEGLKYAKDSYDIDRYNKLLVIAAQNYAPILAQEDQTIREKLRSEIGVVTPKLGSEAAVLNHHEQLLILRRSDDNLWCLPCGWVDVTENPAEAAVREVREETGLIVCPESYIALSCKGPSMASNLQHQVNTITLMKPVASEENITLSHEHTEYKWVGNPMEETAWHPGHREQAQRVFDFLASDRKQSLAI